MRVPPRPPPVQAAPSPAARHTLCGAAPACSGSVYMHKDRDGPLAAGPAWCAGGRCARGGCRPAGRPAALVACCARRAVVGHRHAALPLRAALGCLPAPRLRAGTTTRRTGCAAATQSRGGTSRARAGQVRRLWLVRMPACAACSPQLGEISGGMGGTAPKRLPRHATQAACRAAACPACAGQAGGSAISPEGWRFSICSDQERCKIDPTDGISRWYRWVCAAAGRPDGAGASCRQRAAAATLGVQPGRGDAPRRLPRLSPPCRRMWQDPRFSGGAAQRWAQLRAGPWSDATIARMFADTTAQVCAATGLSALLRRGAPRSMQHGLCSCATASIVRRSPLPACVPPQIKPAVMRNFEKYAAVLIKPWYSGAEQEWTSGAAAWAGGTRGCALAAGGLDQVQAGSAPAHLRCMSPLPCRGGQPAGLAGQAPGLARWRVCKAGHRLAAGGALAGA